MKVSPNDRMSAVVTYAKNKVTVTLTNDTTGATFSTFKSGVSYKRTSAEWITEAPSSSSGLLPLADFGTTYFGVDKSGNFIPDICRATIGKTTADIGGFGNNVQQITMVSKSDGVTPKAIPSSLLDASGSEFTMTFKQAL